MPESPDAAPLPTNGSAAVCGVIRQATSPGRFEVVIIREGFARGDMDGGPFLVDGRPLFWTKQGIESGVEVYSGAAVTAFRLGDEFNHLPGDLDGLKGKAALNEVGRLSNVRVEQAADGLHELRATLTLHEGTPPLVASVLQAWADETIPLAHRGGFSIDARAEFLPAIHDGKAVTQGVRILPNPTGSSVDLVSHPAAGGQVIRKIAASIRGTAPKESKMADPAKQDAPAAADAAEVARIKQEAEASRSAAAAALKEIEEGRKALRVERTEGKVRQAIVAADLPEKAAALVSDAFKGAEAVEDAALKAKIEQVRQALNLDLPVVDGAGISVGLESRDKLEIEIEGMLSRSSDPEWAGKRADGKHIRQALRENGLVKPASFLAHFRDRTGQDFARIKGMAKRDRARVQQSVTVSTYGDAFENVLNRRFLAFYENPDYAGWRQICTNITTLPNYVKQERITVGAYANAPTVSEGQNYTEATSPGDTGNGYTPAKYGFTESVTEEAFLRDDVGILASIPARMGTAMARTVYETIFDLIKPSNTSLTMDYDGEYLYDTDHDVNQNKGTTALSAAEILVVLKAMRKFTDQTASKRMGVLPKFLIVPVDLENTAWDIVKPMAELPPGSTTDNGYLRKFGLQVVTVRHWTDATDWAVGADPMTAPGLEVGFVGSETPEFFVQDNASIGSVFDRDAVTYKTRISFGGNVGRHESFYGEVVAG